MCRNSWALGYLSIRHIRLRNFHIRTAKRNWAEKQNKQAMKLKAFIQQTSHRQTHISQDFRDGELAVCIKAPGRAVSQERRDGWGPFSWLCGILMQNSVRILRA